MRPLPQIYSVSIIVIFRRAPYSKASAYCHSKIKCISHYSRLITLARSLRRSIIKYYTIRSLCANQTIFKKVLVKSVIFRPIGDKVSNIIAVKEH